MRVAITTLVAVGLFACVGGSKEPAKERRVLAHVNGVPITVDDFRREFARVRLDDEEGTPTAESMAVQRRALLDGMVERKMVLQEADKVNVLVGIDEVEKSYDRLRAGWDDRELDELLDKKDTTVAELKAQVRETLMLQKYFTEHVFARIAVTDDDIRTYLEGHPQMQIIPEQVRALQIVVKTEEKANEVLKVLKKELTFEEAAIKYSLSPEAKNGGDLGFFARGSMPRVFDEVCFALRLNEVSKVVPSDYGHHIFKVIEKRAETLKPTSQVRDEVENLLRREREREAYRKKVDELRKATEIVVDEKELARVL